MKGKRMSAIGIDETSRGTARVVAEGNTLFVKPVAGRLEVSDVGPIYEEFQAFLRSRPGIVVLDFQAVERLAAGYAALLLQMKTVAESHGTKFILRNIPAQLQAILRIYKLENEFEVERAYRPVA